LAALEAPAPPRLASRWPLAGRWTLTLGVLVSDFDKRRIAVTLQIR